MKLLDIASFKRHTDCSESCGSCAELKLERKKEKKSVKIGYKNGECIASIGFTKFTDLRKYFTYTLL